MVVSDVNGMASFLPTAGGIDGPVLFLGSASAGAGGINFELQSLLPVN
jgi:hypothetical protein